MYDMSYTVLEIIIIRALGVMHKLELDKICVKFEMYSLFV